jgi:hypothetical protein
LVRPSISIISALLSRRRHVRRVGFVKQMTELDEGM